VCTGCPGGASIVGVLRAAREDEREEDLLLLGQVAVDGGANIHQQVGQALGAVRFVRVRLLHFARQLDEPRELRAQRRVVAVEDVLNELVERAVCPSRLVPGAGAGDLDFAQHGFGVHVAGCARLAQRLLSAAAVVQPVPLEDLGGGGVGSDHVSEGLIRAHGFASAVRPGNES
jgi:hypothetical protein